jgi:hypothetical protein
MATRKTRRVATVVSLDKLIDRHLQHYNRHEKQAFDKARKFYRGEFYNFENSNLDRTTQSYLCSKNLIYAIADTAVSALLGPNPQVAAMARTPTSEEAAPAVSGLMEYIFQTNRMRRRAATALIDAVLCKRGIFKTSWNVKEDRPVVRIVDPSALFFDLTVRDPDDIKYWLEATVIPYSEFKARVEQGRYKSPNIEDVQPDRYPKWLTSSSSSNGSDTRDAFRWVTIWEYYDRERGIVQHYSKQANAVLFEDKIDYTPYSMFSLNHSAVDCSGLSEVQLVLNQQQTVNDLLTHMKQIVYLQVPRILYDAGMLTEEDLNKAVEASAGSFVGVTPQNSETIRNLGALFYQLPMPETPAGVVEFVNRQESDAAFISALAEAARGQVTGARTATEMAIIDAQMRTRLATREGHVNDALEDVAKKSFFLCKKYMQKEKMVRIAGDRKWAEVNLKLLRDVDVEFETVSYNPIRQNPSVLAETMMQMLPFLAGDPNIDSRRLVEEVISGLGMPARILMPEEDVMAAQQAQAMAAQQQSLGGAAAGEPALIAGAVEQISQQEEDIAAASADEAFAAGGGAPVREGAEA